ncbi:MAG: HDIG domain-containing protein [Anaerolineales bacterium]|nr:HDIG domain-containing protein [Anaerolineales bacterium]
MSMLPARVNGVSRGVIFWRVLLLLAAGVLAYVLVVLPLTLTTDALPVRLGDVAPRDLQAPRSIEYVSEVRTDNARQLAETNVLPVYTPADPAAARQQLGKLRDALEYISIVRADAFSTREQKHADLEAMQEVNLEPETIQRLLDLSEPRWDAIQQESLSVLEQVMRNTIRQNDLDSYQRRVPSLVSLALTEQQAELVSALVAAFVEPNSLYSEDFTNSARQEARDAVEPVVQAYKEGETIVESGEIIKAIDMEALEKLDMVDLGSQVDDYFSSAALVTMVAAFVWVYFTRRKLPVLNSYRNLILLTLIFLIFLAGARVAIPGRTVLPYAYPLPAFGLLIATLFGLEIGLVFSLIISLLAAFGLSNTLDLTPYFLLASLSSVLVLGPARRVRSFALAGIAITGAGIAMILAYRFPFFALDWLGTLQLFGAVAFNGIASASLAFLLQYFLAQILGMATTLQLLEISRPDTPLLRYFLQNAPGTYQHSLQVANLAEQAAERIGADALLTRIGALFHDIGKAKNPAFFIENQAPGSINTHDDLQPEDSAMVIIKHVTDGVALARKYRLPKRMEDFILEHHGEMITSYQYNKAVEAAGGDESKVDKELFRYPGPAPRSKETALLMLADGVEARARARKPEGEEELRKMIQEAVNAIRKSGQLDNTQLTLRDLNTIVNSFAMTLRGTYHPRIKYPQAKEKEADTAAESKPSPTI